MNAEIRHRARARIRKIDFGAKIRAEDRGREDMQLVFSGTDAGHFVAALFVGPRLPGAARTAQLNVDVGDRLYLRGAAPADSAPSA